MNFFWEFCHGMKTDTGQDINIAADWLKSGEVVAIPTETVYGLAGNAMDAAAIEKIYAVKQRPATNPLIVHIPDVAMLDTVCAFVPPLVYKLASKFWPGPLTFVLPKQEAIPMQVTAGKPTVGVRMPNHPLTLSLLKQLSFPLAAPSANLYGRLSPTRASHVLSQLSGNIPYVLDGGPCMAGIESTIIGFENDKIIVYRVGAVSIESLQETGAQIVLQQVHTGAGSQMAAGMSLSHYAPSAALLLADDDELDVAATDHEHTVLIRFRQAHTDYSKARQLILSAKGSMSEAAHHLYEYLHQADTSDTTLIIAQRFPAEGLGISINDRLQRASVR